MFTTFYILFTRLSQDPALEGDAKYLGIGLPCSSFIPGWCPPKDQGV